MFSLEIVTLARLLIDEARERSLRIVTAESCTGGLVAGAICSISGSSDVFERGFVTYSNQAKEDLLGVSGAMIRQHGAVSEAVARAMAEGAIRNSAAQLALAITGVAGPGGGSEEKPVGLVHIAAARAGEPTLHREFRFGDIGRGNVRRKSVEAAMEMLEQLVQ